MYFNSLVHILFFGSFLEITAHNNVEVISSFGRINGNKLSINNGGHIMYEFLKIPYAVPPVGKLRFKKPVPHPPLTGVYDATEFGPSCMQYLTKSDEQLLPNKNISEDCLHLNIIVPNNIGPIPKAVMIWIHGGGYIHGQSSIYDVSSLAATGDVIIVSVNYRLGLFGFISSEDSIYPGNYGLWDQLEAIKWTRNHIRSFGGDPRKITIFGESAGAYSAGLLSMLPKSKGLFQRVICQSGVGLSPRAITHNMREKSFKAMQIMGCLNGNNITDKTIQCLESADANLVLSASHGIFQAQDPLDFYITYGPVVDGDLIPDEPHSMLQNTSSASHQVLKSLDIILGHNSADGGFLLHTLMALQGLYNYSIFNGAPTDAFCKSIIPMISKQYFSSNQRVSDTLCRTYTEHDDQAKQARSIIDFYGDMFFGVPTVKTLNYHLTSPKSSYQYLFSEKPFNVNMSTTPWFHGAIHGVDLLFVFGRDLLTQDERRLSQLMMRYWTNFANTGNPNIGGSGDPVWYPYNSGKAYLDLSLTPSTHHELFSHRYDVWLKTLPLVLSGSNPVIPVG